MNIGSMTPARIYVRPEKPEWKAAGRLWQGIPGIERTKKGRLYALWYSGGETEQPGNVVILEKSDDDGESWTDGLCVIAHDDPAVRCFDPCIWRDPSGKLWIFWSQSAGFFDGRVGVWASVCRDPDGEPVFSDPVRLFDGIMLNKPIVTGKGEWLFPAALWGREQAEPQEEHPDLEDRRLAWVYASTDGGRTFEARGGTKIPGRSYDEHMLIERTDGLLWMLVRTTYGIGQAFSPDGGRTWEKEGPSGHTGPNSRFFIRRLKNGKILLVNHLNPTYGTDPKKWNTRNNLAAMLSADDGKTWEGALVLDTRNGVSYPDAAEGENGEIYLTYDYDRYGAREILLSVFTQEDILTGTLQSPNGRLHHVISRAAGRKEGEKNHV